MAEQPQHRSAPQADGATAELGPTGQAGPGQAGSSRESQESDAEGRGLSRARFLTVQEVADLLRVSSMTVYRLIKSGDLPAVRVGRSFRVSDRDVDGYLASRYTQAG